MTPTLQMSTQKWQPLPSSTYGAMQFGVPHTVLLHSLLNYSLVARPKSPILMRKFPSMKMLPSFRSRCMIFWEWMYLSPLARPIRKDCTSGVMKLPLTLMSSLRDWFSQSQRKIQTWSLSSQQWQSSTTLGWWRVLCSRIQLARRSLVRCDFSSSLVTILVAAWRLVSMFSVMQQLANPPRPSMPVLRQRRVISSPSMRLTFSVMTASSGLLLGPQLRREARFLCLERLIFYSFKYRIGCCVDEGIESWANREEIINFIIRRIYKQTMQSPSSQFNQTNPARHINLRPSRGRVRSQIDQLLNHDYALLQQDPPPHPKHLHVRHQDPLIMEYVEQVYQDYQLRDPLPSGGVATSKRKGIAVFENSTASRSQKRSKLFSSLEKIGDTTSERWGERVGLETPAPKPQILFKTEPDEEVQEGERKIVVDQETAVREELPDVTSVETRGLDQRANRALRASQHYFEHEQPQVEDSRLEVVPSIRPQPVHLRTNTQQVFVQPAPLAQYATQHTHTAFASSNSSSNKPVTHTRHLRINTQHAPQTNNFPINYTQTTHHRAQPTISFNVNTPQHMKRSQHLPPIQPTQPSIQPAHYQTEANRGQHFRRETVMIESQHLINDNEMKRSQHLQQDNTMRHSHHLPRQHVMRSSQRMDPPHPHLTTHQVLVPRGSNQTTQVATRIVHPQKSSVPLPAGSVVIRQPSQVQQPQQAHLQLHYHPTRPVELQTQQRIQRPHIVIAPQSSSHPRSRSPSNAISSTNRPVSTPQQAQQSYSLPPNAASQDIISYEPPPAHSASEEIVIVEAPDSPLFPRKPQRIEQPQTQPQTIPRRAEQKERFVTQGEKSESKREKDLPQPSQFSIEASPEKRIDEPLPYIQTPKYKKIGGNLRFPHSNPNNLPTEPVVQRYRYCIGCDQALLQANIAHHETTCESYQRVFSMDPSEIVNYLKEKIHRYERVIKEAGGQLLQQDAAQLNQRSERVMEESRAIVNEGTITNRFRDDYGKAMGIGVRWGQMTEAINRVNWYLMIRQRIKEQFSL